MTLGTLTDKAADGVDAVTATTQHWITITLINVCNIFINCTTIVHVFIWNNMMMAWRLVCQTLIDCLSHWHNMSTFINVTSLSPDYHNIHHYGTLSLLSLVIMVITHGSVLKTYSYHVKCDNNFSSSHMNVQVQCSQRLLFILYIPSLSRINYFISLLKLCSLLISLLSLSFTTLRSLSTVLSSHFTHTITAHNALCTHYH